MRVLVGRMQYRVAPAVGLEPTTKRLTAARSTTELRRSEGSRKAIGAARGRAAKDSISGPEFPSADGPDQTGGMAWLR